MRHARASTSHIIIHSPSLFLFLCFQIVNLYGTYGEYVTDAIFPPRTSSAAVVCADGIRNDYMVKYNRFQESNDTDHKDGGWVFLNATQPVENLVMAWDSHITSNDSEDEDSDEEPPSSSPADINMVDAAWDQKNVLKVWLPKRDACVNVIVWSI